MASFHSHQYVTKCAHSDIFVVLIAQLKKEKQLLDCSLSNKDTEIIDIHKQLEASHSAVRTDDNRIRLLETQV